MTRSRKIFILSNYVITLFLNLILSMYNFCILMQMWLSFVSFTETLYHYVYKSFVAPRSVIDLMGALVLRRLTWVWNAFAPALIGDHVTQFVLRRYIMLWTQW